MSSPKPEISIIILTYNVKKLLLDCLKSLYQSKPKGALWQVIVVDNGSSDASLEAVTRYYPQVETIRSEANLGFSAGNNLGVKKAKADFILFLNPDTLIVGQVVTKSLEFIKSRPEVGALTCRVELPTGKLDYSCHRGFPTPWNAFCHFSGLSKRFPKSKLLAGYSATYLDINTTHEMDCGTGAFLLVRKKAGDQINWWDEDYFWNGEDIEFCFSLKEKGWKIIFYPEVKIIHFKGSSSGLQSTRKTEVPQEVKMMAAKSAARAMKIFYQKHYHNHYPFFTRWLILLGIELLERYRFLKIYSGLKYE